MKVAMINTARQRGGAARMASTLTQALNAGPLAKARLYHCEDDIVTDDFVGLRKRGSRQLNALLARLGGSLCVADLGVAHQLGERVRDIDLLHLHNLHGYYLNYRHLLRHWGERPIVWTWHDMWGATGRCGAGYECLEWQSGCTHCPHTKFYPAAWIDNAASEFKKKQDIFLTHQNLWIVTPSEWLAGVATRRGFRADRVLTIPNPVNPIFTALTRPDARNQLGLDQEIFIALFIASDCGDPRKGYGDFAASIAATDVKGIAIGQPPTHASPHIHHTGTLADAATLNRYYAAADVMVIPSYADNYPTTVIESLICGTPVIGYNEGGIPSQLDDMPHCRIVEKGDVVALRNALGDRLNRGKKSAEIMEQVARHAVARWSPQLIAERYLSVYREAVRTWQRAKRRMTMDARS